MITVTNQKVQGYKPIWAPFKGYSLVFNNPGNSLTRLDNYSELEKMDCQQEDHALSFYQGLWKHAAYLNEMTNSYLFCPLPHHSYHVTVWDGLNDFNASKVNEAYRTEAEQLLQGLPESFLSSSPFFKTGNGNPIHAAFNGKMRFKFDQLHISQALTVRLKPADSASEEIFKVIHEQRNALIEDFQQRFGITTTRLDYKPHVSLGYFANDELINNATSAIENLNQILKKDMEGKTIDFSSISLYGMTNMETFYRQGSKEA